MEIFGNKISHLHLINDGSQISNHIQITKIGKMRNKIFRIETTPEN